MSTPNWLSARARVGMLKHHRSPDDPAIAEAERALAATPRHSEPWVSARARLAALKKHRDPGDPEIAVAERDMKLAYREYRLRQLAEELLASAPEAAEA